MKDTESYPSHGGQIRQIAERFSVPVSELLDFSANINPAGPSPLVLSALRAGLDIPSTVVEYPDMQQTDLKHVIASYTRTTPENIVVANGFVPLLEVVLRTLKIRTCLLPVPAFVEYRKTLLRAGVSITNYQLSLDSAFGYDPEEMLVGQFDAVLLANPQNPSGVCHDVTSMLRLITEATSKDMYVLLDEAFIDYVPQHSLTAMIEHFPKLLVFRSVTKFHGIPGLRVAYAVANCRCSEMITDALPPWPVTTLASLAVMASLRDDAYAISSILRNKNCRSALQAGLVSCGLALYPASANYILFRLQPQFDPGKFWERMITGHRIVIRSCANYEGLSRWHFRIAVRGTIENELLVKAIRSTLHELES